MERTNFGSPRSGPRLGLQVNGLRSKASLNALHPEHQAFIELFRSADWRVELFDWRDTDPAGLVCGHVVDASSWAERSDVPLESLADIVMFRSLGSVERDRDQLSGYWQSLDKAFAKRVLNQPSWMHRGSDKQYLLDLQADGRPVIPTVLASGLKTVDDVRRVSSWPLAETVMKPVHGECGNSVVRGDELTDDWLEGRRGLVDTWILQRFVPEVSEGERSLLFIGGRYCYAVMKRPRPDDFRNNHRWIGSISLYSPTPAELELATSLVESVPEPPHICRVDLLNSKDGPLILEFETVNPSLYIGQVDGDKVASALTQLELLARTLTAG